MNSAGASGPWSDIWNFTTFTPLPTTPQLVAAAPYPNRDGWVAFRWMKVQNTDQYAIQLSDSQSFATVKVEYTSSDTFKILSGFSEGQKFYWRVQARNLAGSGPWSEISGYTLVLPPTDLALQRSGVKEITLSWTDRSSVEIGYLIERKQSLQTSFTLLDTLRGSGSQYIDKKVEQAQTYTYRVKAYTNAAESDYSNEASIVVVVGVKKEEIPTEYSIGQNYPNPFNPSTEITFAIPKASRVTLTIIDALGRVQAVLVDGEKSAGTYTVSWNASNVPSGTYIYRLWAGEYTATRKMLLIK
jgi:hypothetical protein